MDPRNHPKYAVIFRTESTGKHVEEYAKLSSRLLEIAKDLPGFCGIETVKDSGGRGISVSYWTDENSIQKWKQHTEHLIAQERGKKLFYRSYSIEVCSINRAYSGPLT